MAVETPPTDLEAERALLTGKVNALLVSIYSNERPLQGLAGLMDWRLRGQLSECLKKGAITGSSKEITLYPFRRGDRKLHLILLGLGPQDHPGQRNQLSPEDIELLRKRIPNLQLGSIGVSSSDVGSIPADQVERKLKEIQPVIFS